MPQGLRAVGHVGNEPGHPFAITQRHYDRRAGIFNFSHGTNTGEAIPVMPHLDNVALVTVVAHLKMRVSGRFDIVGVPACR